MITFETTLMTTKAMTQAAKPTAIDRSYDHARRFVKRIESRATSTMLTSSARYAMTPMMPVSTYARRKSLCGSFCWLVS